MNKQGFLLAIVVLLSVSGCLWKRGRQRPEPPATHIEMTVAGVVTTTQGGKVVLLVDGADKVALPIFIGGTEALSIELRLKKERYARPLTHDLLESVTKQLGGEIEKVQVDDLRDNVFIGTVFLRAGRRVSEIDARPSDAIALAIGAEAPIFVARKVVEAAGVNKDELDPKRKPKTPVDPMSL
jgi:uncharacterized protein